jgi:hypothetical protein
MSNTPTPPPAKSLRQRIRGLKPLELISLFFAAYGLLYEATSARYTLELDAAVSERASIETLLSSDRLDLALRGFGPAQTKKVPSSPPSFWHPIRWFIYDEISPFKRRLHDELESALRAHAYDYATGVRRLDAQGANLENADLKHVLLRYAQLSYSCLKHVDLSSSDLSQASLGGADLTSATLAGSLLIDAKLYESNLAYAKAPNANFSGAFLENASLNSADLSRATFANASLQCADLSGSDLREINSWSSIKTIQHANIHNVRNPPIGFKAFALKNGAKNDMDAVKWEDYRRENCSKAPVVRELSKACQLE